MPDLAVRAISESVGLRRETTVDPVQLPLWLARLHKALPPGDIVRFSISETRRLPIPFDALLDGAGFAQDNGGLVRLDSLPDIVNANMRVLVCGLNPSPSAAEAGVPFNRNGNRFWPAALRAGLLTKDRDPYAALLNDGVGFTDLVKRTTRRADDLSVTEFQSGAIRVERLVQWLNPKVVVIVGLGGWRAREAASSGKRTPITAGWQTESLGQSRVYVMPNTSGLNAHENLASLTEHLDQVHQAS